MADQETQDSITPPTQSDDMSHSHSSSSSPAPPLSRTLSSSRLNANAPEFVPGRTTPPRMMIPPPPPPPFLYMYHHHPPPPPFHYSILGPIPTPPYERRRDRKKIYQAQTGASVSIDPKSGLPDNIVKKIVNKVEYYFSDLNLATTDVLMRFSSMDPQGYVPINIVADFNEIKSFINSNSQLATVLQNSSKLVVSEDGKKVRRIHPITKNAIEELQSRIVIARNLPEDHCYQNLMKIFSAVGSVKHIRTCPPLNSGKRFPSVARSAKTDFINKWHAFVEYESVELAEKAVAELNEERNWSGLRVQLLVQHNQTKEPEHVLEEGGRKEEDDATTRCEEQEPNDEQFEDCGGERDGHVQEQTVGDECQMAQGDSLWGGENR